MPANWTTRDIVPLVKRSLTVNGHRTSVALEPPFWDALEAAAGLSGETLEQFIGRVDAMRGGEPLASTLRVYALQAARNTLPG